MSKHQYCRNCGHRVDNNYCPACGQRTTVDRICWKTLFESLSSTFVGDEAFGVQGINMRKGVVGTWFTILCHPFVSLSEYIGGHQRKYFNPLAILLMLSTFYLIAFYLLGGVFRPIANDRMPTLLWLMATCIDYIQQHPATSVLLDMPILAWVMKRVFARYSDLSYVEYLYVVIFVGIAELTTQLLLLPMRVYGSSSFQIISSMVGFGYMVVIFRYFFQLTWWQTIRRNLLTICAFYVVMFFCIATVIGLTIGGYGITHPDEIEQLEHFGDSTQLQTVDSIQLPAQADPVDDFLNGMLDVLNQTNSPTGDTEPAK